MRVYDAYGMAKSVDIDYTAPFRSGSAPFAKSYLAQYLDFYDYCQSVIIPGIV